MTRGELTRWGLAMTMVLAQACANDGPSGGPGVPPPAWITVLQPGVVYLPPSCDTPLAEACNAIDDDCDGAIDEDCGVTTGDVQVTMMMLDELQTTMHLQSAVPGHRLGRTSADAEYGGYYESGAGGCTFAGHEDFIENGYWAGVAPDFLAPSGTYTVELAVTSDCTSTRPAAPVRVGVSVHGVYAGAFEWEVPFEEFGSTESHPVLELDVE